MTGGDWSSRCASRAFQYSAKASKNSASLSPDGKLIAATALFTSNPRFSMKLAALTNASSSGAGASSPLTLYSNPGPATASPANDAARRLAMA